MRILLLGALFCTLGVATAVPLGAARAESVLDGIALRPLAGREPVDLAQAHAGQVLLVVNTASKCGFTPQYEGLEALHQRFGEQGFAVLGFPSGDFAGQEFDDEEQIAEFCTLTYGVAFPMFERVPVKGDDATPLFKRLSTATGTEPGWNFHKYLVSRSGEVVADFGSRVRPEDPSIVSAIEAELAR